jgi:hypothetical protein
LHISLEKLVKYVSNLAAAPLIIVGGLPMDMQYSSMLVELNISRK